MPSPSPRAAAYTPPAQPDFFVQTPVSVVRCRTLTPVQKTTYDVLCSYADATGTAYLGQARLAAEVGCSERTVRDAVHILVAAGLVAVRRRGQGLTNLYHLTRIPLRAPRSRADRQGLPVQNGRPRRPKAAPVAAESDPLERDPAKRDQPPAGEGGGEIAAQIAADTTLIATATGMAPDEAQATAEVAAASGHGPGYVAELVAHVTSSPSVQNPAGCLRALVQQGKRRPPRGAGGVPPRAQRAALHPEHYGPEGKYAHLFHRVATASPSLVQSPTATRRGPSAFEIAANPQLAGRGMEAWPRGQPLTGP
jgi:hypothetical protein